MRRALFGYAAADFLFVALRLTMIRNLAQIDRQALAPAVETLGPAVGQGGIDAAVQFLIVRQRGFEGLSDRLVRGRIPQAS